MLKGIAIRYTIGTTNTMILHSNISRQNLYLEADKTNSGSVFINWNDPAQTNTGDRAGLQLSAGQSIWDIHPCNQESVYAIGSASGQVLIFREDSTENNYKENCLCYSCEFKRLREWV